MVDAFLEGLPEFFQQGNPFLLTAGHGIQLVFELGGEVVVHVLGEVVGEKLVHHPAHVRGIEALLLQLHVFAVLESGDDAGIGGGPADAMLFQGFYQAGLAVAWRRLGKVLFGTDGQQVHLLAFLEEGQHLLVAVLGLLVVLAFLVHGHEAGVDDGGAVGAEQVAFAGGQVRRHGVQGGMHHLAGQGALPDQVVEPGLFLAQVLGEILRVIKDGSRADGLVGFLGVLGLGLEHPGLVRHLLLAVLVGDIAADLVNGLVGQGYGVGTHVGDQTHGAIADVHAFIQLLGHAHGAVGGEAQLARRFLLQGGGGEGRCRVAPALLLGDLDHIQLAAGLFQEGLFDFPGLFFLGDGELLHLVATVLGQLGLEFGAFLLEVGFHGPVLAALEGFDLFLALDDHAQGGALHPSGGQAAADLLPQQGRQVETYQVVQGAPRLLGIDQIHGQFPGMGDGVLHGLLCDLVEHHPVHGLALEVFAVLQQLIQMPGDGFTFAVRVSRQVQGVGVLEFAGDGLDVLVVALDGLVLHLEIVLGIHSAFFGYQVAYVSVGGEYLEVLAKIFLDGLGLGR